MFFVFEAIYDEHGVFVRNRVDMTTHDKNKAATRALELEHSGKVSYYCEKNAY